MFSPHDLGTVQNTRRDPGTNGYTWIGRVAIVGGCGHVGLPLGLAFAKVGIRVDLIDTSLERVDLVNRGRMPFKEEGADELLPELIDSGQLRATTDSARLRDAESVIVTIGTPVSDFGDPAIGPFDRAMDKVLAQMRPGQLLVLGARFFPA